MRLVLDKTIMRGRIGILLCLLPGSTSTLFVVLALANGGEIFGLSAEWLLNCSLLAVPFLTLIVALLARALGLCNG
jgi:hypothetical protein